MPLGQGIFEAFQTGQQIAGTSAFGDFIRNITDRVNQMDLLRAQSAFKYQTELPYQIALEKAKIQLDPEKRLLASLLPQEGQEVPGTAGVPGGLPPAGQGGMTRLQSSLGPGQRVHLGPFDISSVQPIPEEVSKRIGAMKPVKGSIPILPFLKNQGNAQSNANELASIIPTLTDPQQIEAVRSIVASGAILPEHQVALSSQFRSTHPELADRDPFVDVTSASPLSGDQNIDELKKRYPGAKITRIR